MIVKCLVVGNGPSYKNYDFIKNFDGKILCVDVSTIDLIEHGIIPDYHLFHETHEHLERNLDILMPDLLFDYKNKITVVHRSQSLKILPNRIRALEMESIVFNADKYGNENAINNVGLYSVLFADEILRADEIHLIGLDYGKSLKYNQERYNAWIASTLHYFRNKDTESIIIDHSDGNFPKYTGKGDYNN